MPADTTGLKFPKRANVERASNIESFPNVEYGKMRSELNECALGVDLRGIHSAFYRTRHLERNAELGISFHVFEENLLATAVIEFGGPAVGVPCDALCYFERAVI